MEGNQPQFESVWTRVSGMALHARACQIGPGNTGVPVVLVPGLGLSSRAMMPSANLLAAKHPVYALDLPGYGLSAKPHKVLTIRELADALNAWMEAQRFDAAVVVGNSVGCQIAVDMAVRHSDRTGRLVLTGPTMPPPARSLFGSAIRWAQELPMETPMMPTMLRDYRDCGPRRFLGLAQYAREDRIEDKMPHLKMPVLLMRGERDPIVSQEWTEHLTQLVPQGRMMVVPKAAHNLTFLAADAVAEGVEIWMHPAREQEFQESQATHRAA